MSSSPISSTPPSSSSSQGSTPPSTPPPSQTPKKATQVAQQRIHTPPSPHPHPKLQSRNISILKGVGYGLLGLVGTITGIALIALSGGTVLIVGAGAAATAGLIAGGTGALIVGAAATYQSSEHLNVAKKTPWSPLPPRADFEKFYNEKKKHLLHPILGEANLSDTPKDMNVILTDVALDIARGSVICYQGIDYPTTEQQKEMASWPFEKRCYFARTIVDELHTQLKRSYGEQNEKIRHILFLCQQSFPATSVLPTLINEGQQKMIEGLDPSNPLFFFMPSQEKLAVGEFRISIEESKEGTKLTLDAPGVFCAKVSVFPNPQDCYLLGVRTTMTIGDGEIAHFKADVKEEGRLDRVLAERFYYSPTQFFNEGVGIKIIGEDLSEELAPPERQDLATAASDLTNKLKKASQVIKFKEITYEDANALVTVLQKEGLSDSTILAVLTRCDPSLPRVKLEQNYDAFLSSIGIPPQKRKRYRLTSLPTEPIALKITEDKTAELSYPGQKFHFVDKRNPGSPVSGEITCSRSITVADDGTTKHSLAMTM